MNTYLSELLNPSRLTEIVDIGANPIDGPPPYKSMLDIGLCRVTGFEPQKEALSQLQLHQGPNERYLPYAVGDGCSHTLHICRASGMTSLFQPDPARLGLFAALAPLGDVIQKMPIQTVNLDSIAEINNLDFLKIDIQGGELAVFQSGKIKLTQAVAIQTEVSFITLYKDQPSMGEIDSELRTQGFIPHCFAAIKKWPITPCVVNNNPRQALNQLLEADIVYVRDFSQPDTLSDEQLKHLALISHHIYGSFDLAMHCLMLLENRNAISTGTQQKYLQNLTQR